jgi:hypothetical protein
MMHIPIRVLVSTADQSTWSHFVPIGYRALTRAVLTSLNFPDNHWFCSNTVHVINLCPESTAQRWDYSGYTCGADQCEGI